MHGESPEFKRCCFCLPLRRGLIGWGYFKLAVDVLVLIRFIYIMVLYGHLGYFDLELFLSFAFIIFYASDAVFAVILIVGGHKKSHKLLRASKTFSMVWLVPIVILGGLLAYSDIARIHRRGISPFTLSELALDMSVIATIIFLQVYVILLTRSEEIKLRKEDLGMQFVNNAADGESVCVCTDNGHDAEIVH